MTRIAAVVISDLAPRPIGPYSQAVESDGMIYLSGQIGMDPKTGELVPGGAKAQTETALKNLCSVLSAAGADVGDVLRVCIYLKDIKDFPEVNEVYGRVFSSWRPARTTIGGLELPKGALIEIDAVARLHG